MAIGWYDKAVVTVTVKQVRSRIDSLLERVADGEEVVITKDDKPLARLVAAGGESSPAATPVPQPGNAKGALLYMAEDFNAPLAEFEEYS